MTEPQHQSEYTTQLEEANERLIANLERGVGYFWTDKRKDNDKASPVTRSDLRIMGIVVAYVVLVGDKWSVYYLRREDTKKFSGYRFCRLEGTDNKPANKVSYYMETGLDRAKELAYRAVI